MPKNYKKNKSRNLKELTGSSSSIEPLQSSDADNVFNENFKDVETSFHIKNNKRVDLPSLIPVTDIAPVHEEYNSIDTNSPKGNTFRKRVRALTSISVKSSTESDRHSWESKSSPTKDSRAGSGSFGDSVTTQGTNSTELSPVSASTITQSPKGKKKSGKGPSSRKFSLSSIGLKYLRSPHDYMIVDLDYCEAQAAMKHNEPDRDPEIWKSSLDDLLAYVRRMTGTKVVAISTNDPKVPRRPNEARAWYHRNLWCVDCRESCPICNTTCCIREGMALKASDENLSPEEVQHAKRLGKIIEFLGINARDISTFSQCTPPDGCGRYVCTSCCGVCPNEICRDIQCKDCKPDVWKSCDWHD